jgi:hypothetical protein
MLRFACPSCQAPLSAQPEHAGKESTCAKCGQSFRVPAGTLAPLSSFAAPPQPASIKKQSKRNDWTLFELIRVAVGSLGVLLGLLITLLNWGTERYRLESPVGRNDRLAGVIVGIGWTLAGLLIVLFARRR